MTGLAHFKPPVSKIRQVAFISLDGFRAVRAGPQRVFFESA